MGLIKTKVKNSSKPLKQCVYLEVTEDTTDLHKFAVVDKTNADNNLESNKDRHFYRFPKNLKDKCKAKGVKIQLYTGKGKATFEDASKTLKLYRGLDTCICNYNGNDEAQLFQLNSIMKKKVAL